MSSCRAANANGERVFVGDGPNSPDAWEAAGALHEAAKHLPSALDEIERQRAVDERWRGINAEMHGRLSEALDVVGLTAKDNARLRDMIIGLGLDPDAGCK